MRQLTIDLACRPALGRSDFLVSGCNQAALGWIDRWPDWPSRNLALYGPPQSGKTHLAHLWCERSGGRLVDAEELAAIRPDALASAGVVAVDRAEQAGERALLHLCNCLNEIGGSLLLLARAAPAAWPIALPDLASRLRAMPAVAIMAPDDALLGAVLVKHFADRQLRLTPTVIAFAVRRMERSFDAAAQLAKRLDQMTLGTGRPIGLALARQALHEATEHPREL